jgi:hypothetical protein
MTIDFRLRSKEQMAGRRGLTMQLIPGLPADEVAIKDSVFVSEDAFGFVEPIITRCWPKYSGYAHWGVTTIPVYSWNEILISTKRLINSLLTAANAKDIEGIGFLFEYVKDEFFENFTLIRHQLSSMLEELMAWLEIRMRYCEFITISGI